MMITLANLNTATEQEVFDQVVTHARKQGKKSVNNKGDCMYRHGDGACFGGCLYQMLSMIPEWNINH